MQDLSKYNRDYAVFLPAISTYFATVLDMFRNRCPSGFEKGLDGLEFLQQDAYFFYDKALYSAGHAAHDVEASKKREPIVWNRDKDKTLLMSDSGGFQIGKGRIKFDWERFYEKEGDKFYKGDADRVRRAILNWQENVSDWSMIMDVPSWAVNNEATGMKSFEDCLKATKHNNEFYLANRTPGKTKFLNVLQGGNWEQAELWYDSVKNYPFEGWGMGGRNMCDLEIALKRLVIMRDEGMLENKDWIHFLGTARLDWACMLTMIQRQLRENVNPNITVSFDCASPFLAASYGLIYTEAVHTAERWTYIMESCPHSKAFKGSTMPFPFESEIASRLTMGDICYYGEGDLNSFGKEAKRSWDSITYNFLMSHNLYQHIRAVQMANNIIDIESTLYQPSILDWKRLKGNARHRSPSLFVPLNLLIFKSFIEELFDPKKAHKSMSLIEHNKGFLHSLSNTSNKKSGDLPSEFFGQEITEADDSTELSDKKLEILEASLSEDAC